MKTKIPHTLVFLACFIVAALAISIRNGSVPAVSTAAVNERKTIVIDSGHGGADGGCVGVNGCIEKDINLAIAKDLEALLKLSGFNVVMTRSEDVSIHDEGVEGLGIQTSRSILTQCLFQFTKINTPNPNTSAHRCFIPPITRAILNWLSLCRNPSESFSPKTTGK